MPRRGWVAVGAVAIALAAPTGRLAVAAVVTAVAIGLALVAWRSPARPSMRAVRTAGLGVVVGVALIGGRLSVTPSKDGVTPAPEGRGPWTMLVESVGSPRDGHQVATLRQVDGLAPVATSATSTTAATDDTALRLAATLPRYPRVDPGDIVQVEGRVRERPDSPYGRYLERLGAWGTLQADDLVRLDRANGPGADLERWRRSAGDALTRVLPEPEAGLAAGILIGLRDRVDRDVAAAFTTAGVSHVVAISGWNIAIVAASIAALGGRLGRRRRAVLTVVAVVAYVAFAGASPSVLRAGVMAGVVLLARESGRPERAATALAWAVVVLLLADPGLVADAGFQLSSLATAGLIAWATPLSERLGTLGRGRLPAWLTESLGVSLAAQAATLPVVLASFGRLALISPAINLLVVPLVAPVMAVGIVALAAGIIVGLGVPAVVGTALAMPAFAGLRIMIGLVAIAAAVPNASVQLEPVAAAVSAVACAAAMGWTVIWRRRRRRDAGMLAPMDGRIDAQPETPRSTPPRSHGRGDRLAIAALIVAVACVGAVATSRPPGVARLAVLDVGQGDAILVEGARGGRLLVDGGPDPDRLLVALDRRIPPWDRRIDVVILSHPHEDHVAGLALLLERYRVGRVLEPGMRGSGQGYEALAGRLGRRDAPPIGIIAAGDRLVVDDVALEVRWPLPGTVPVTPAETGTGINNVSVVLLGQVGDRRFLLTGDIEEDVDPSLLAAGLPTVDVLKVAHHGSRTATTTAFLAATRPRIAIASAGEGNPYGHPATATMERLGAGGARVLRTDVDGTVTVTFEPDGPVVRREPRPTQARRATVATTTTARGRAIVATRRPVFLCAVPGVPGLSLPAAADQRRAVPGEAARAAAQPMPRPGDRPGPVGYHRADDGPRPPGRACPPAVPGSRARTTHSRARRR